MSKEQRDNRAAALGYGDALKNVNVVTFLEELDVKKVRTRGKEAIFSCPFPEHRHGDANPSASMNVNNTAWICFGCGRRGNAVTFLAEMQNISRPLAMRFIRERFEEGWNPKGSAEDVLDEIFARSDEDVPEDESLPMEVLHPYHVEPSNLAKDHPWRVEMASRGIIPGIAKFWGLGWDDHQGRITIPYFDSDDNLVGVKGMLPKAERDDFVPKYVVYDTDTKGWGAKAMHIGRHLFGPNHTYGTGPLVVTEGEMNAIAISCVSTVPSKSVVGLPSAAVTDRQIEVLKSLSDTFVLWLDDDNAGIAGLWKLVKALSGMNVWIVNDVPKGMDACDMNEAQILKALNETVGARELVTKGRV